MVLGSYVLSLTSDCSGGFRLRAEACSSPHSQGLALCPVLETRLTNGVDLKFKAFVESSSEDRHKYNTHTHTPHGVIFPTISGTVRTECRLWGACPRLPGRGGPLGFLFKEVWVCYGDWANGVPDRTRHRQLKDG